MLFFFFFSLSSRVPCPAGMGWTEHVSVFAHLPSSGHVLTPSPCRCTCVFVVCCLSGFWVSQASRDCVRQEGRGSKETSSIEAKRKRTSAARRESATCWPRRVCWFGAGCLIGCRGRTFRDGLLVSWDSLFSRGCWTLGRGGGTAILDDVCRLRVAPVH